MKDICKRIRPDYCNSDIIIYNTPRYRVKFLELGACTGNKIISVVYVNCKFGPVDRFIDSVKNIGGFNVGGENNGNVIPVILILDQKTDDFAAVGVNDLRYFEHVIILKRHNCAQSQVSKFLVYMVKSFQKYQMVLNLYTGTPPAKHTPVTYDLYTFIGVPNTLDNNMYENNNNGRIQRHNYNGGDTSLSTLAVVSDGGSDNTERRPLNISRN